MVTFWIVTGAAALILAAALVLALLRGRRATGPAEAYDLQVYRDQLTEIEADAARGKIPPEEAERLRVEISRRLLSADTKVRETGASGAQPRALGLGMAAVMALLVIGGGFATYRAIGAPGYGDLPLKTRLNQAEIALKTRPSQADVESQVAPPPAPNASADYLALVQRLRGAVAERPNDLRGHMLLARSEAALGNYKAAYLAQAQIVKIKAENATARDFTDLADMMVLAAGGYVSPEAQKVLEQALSRDPENGVARYYGGLMMAQIGRPDVGFGMWNKLLRESGPDDPWVPPIREQIEDLAWLAGAKNFEMPKLSATARGPGPTEADIAAAADMSPEERQAMIDSMIDRLSTRLAEDGGPPEDWARLIFVLGQRGDTEQAGAIYAEAQSVFSANPEALETLREAARQAGVAD